MCVEMDVLRRFEPSDVATYQRWFSDPETRRRISPPDDHWRTHVFCNNQSACWVLDVAEGLGGVLQADWDEDGHAFVSVVIDPARRGQGLGTRLVRSFLVRQGRAFTTVMAGAEPDNRASLRLAVKCGFHDVGTGSDGFVQLRREGEGVPEPASVTIKPLCHSPRV